jgi:hypothetical protein
MKEITTSIATTLPDQLDEKFTKSVLRKFCDQINTAFRKFGVLGIKNEIIGEVISARISKGSLVATMNIDDTKVAKNWEYYFVPEGITKKKEKQGKFLVITEAELKGVSIVMFPSDLSLKPVVFDNKYKENTDYFIRKYDQIESGLVERCIKNLRPLYVYYPDSLDGDIIQKDAEDKGLLDCGKKILPIEVNSFQGTFNQYREIIINKWTLISTENLDSQEKKPIEKKLLN